MAENSVCLTRWGSLKACQRAETRVGMLANHLRTGSSKVGRWELQKLTEILMASTLGHQSRSAPRSASNLVEKRAVRMDGPRHWDSHLESTRARMTRLGPRRAVIETRGYHRGNATREVEHGNGQKSHELVPTLKMDVSYARTTQSFLAMRCFEMKLKEVKLSAAYLRAGPARNRGVVRGMAAW